MRNTCLFCILCGIILYTRAARATPPREQVRLDYVRGPGAQSCPDEAVVRSAIKNKVRYELFNPKAPATLVVTMSGDGGKVRGHAEFRSPAGTWEANAKPEVCEVVVTYLVLEIARKLAPWFADAAGDSPGHDDGGRSKQKHGVVGARPEKAPTPRATPKATRKTPARVRFGVGAGGEVTSGPGPSDITGHPSVMMLLAWRALRLGVEVEYEPPTTTEVRGATLTTWRLTGGLAPCAHWNELFGCAVGQLGASFGKAKAYTSDSAIDLYGAGGGRLGIQLPATSWLTVAVYGELLATFNRPALLVDDERAWVHVGATGAAGAQALVFF